MLPMKPYKLGWGGELHRDLLKGFNSGKIQVIGASRYFVACQVLLIGVSDHCVKKPNHISCPHEYTLKSPMD